MRDSGMTSRGAKVVLLGFALGCATTGCVLIKNALAVLIPNAPGVYIVLLLAGSASIPSLSVCVVNGLCYAAVAFLIALILPKPRIPVGQCQNCGYDLTGNVSRVCPKCGRKIENRPGPGRPIRRGGPHLTRHPD